MKNSADIGGCYPRRPSASVDNTLLDLQNSSYPTQPHSIIANCVIVYVASVLLLTISVTNFQQFPLDFQASQPNISFTNYYVLHTLD